MGSFLTNSGTTTLLPGHECSNILSVRIRGVSPEPSSGSGVSTYNAKHDEICDLEKTVMGLVVAKEERKRVSEIWLGFGKDITLIYLTCLLKYCCCPFFFLFDYVEFHNGF